MLVMEPDSHNELTRVKLIDNGDGYFYVEYLVRMLESVQVYCAECEHGISWYWIAKSFGAMPTSSEIGPFNSKEEAIKHIQFTYDYSSYLNRDGILGE